MSSRRSSLREGSFHLRKRLHVWFRECWPAFAKRKRARPIGEPEGRGTCFGWGSRRNRNPGAAGRRRGGGAAHPNEVRAANNRQNYTSDSPPRFRSVGTKFRNQFRFDPTSLSYPTLVTEKCAPWGWGAHGEDGWSYTHQNVKIHGSMVSKIFPVVRYVQPSIGHGHGGIIELLIDKKWTDVRGGGETSDYISLGEGRNTDENKYAMIFDNFVLPHKPLQAEARLRCV